MLRYKGKRDEYKNSYSNRLGCRGRRYYRNFRLPVYYAIRLLESMMKKWSWFACVILFVAIVLLVRVNYWFTQSINPVTGFFLVYSFAVVISISLRLILCEFYKPIQRDNHYTVSIIIPVFNEEKWIEKTISHCFASDYRHLQEVIVIDDGSTDSTYSILVSLQKVYPALKIIRQRVNTGKREAMILGVRASESDVVVFIDSDSFVNTDAIRKLVNTFDGGRIKGVVGHAHVYPVKGNFTERMQEFNYYTGFTIYKKTESLFGCVTCLSGVLSAYIRTAILEVEGEFINQSFLGQRPTAGDDRSLTTMLLRAGHKTVYQPDALCYTVVPDNLKALTKQRVRWRRSWFRESLLQGFFFYRLNPIGALLFYSTTFIGYTLIIIVSRYLIFDPINGEILSAIGFLLGCLAVVLVMESYYLWHYAKADYLSSFLYCAYNLGVLIWIIPYALVTIRNRKWETRDTLNIEDRKLSYENTLAE